jgi:hypothetical protein
MLHDPKAAPGSKQLAGKSLARVVAKLILVVLYIDGFEVALCGVHGIEDVEACVFIDNEEHVRPNEL